MDDQLDNNLKKRIRDVFDNYDDGHADEGWLLLREKYPEQAKRRPVAWLWWGGSAAALLLLFLGIFLFSKHPKKQNLASVKRNPVASQPFQKLSSPGKKDEQQAKADSVVSSLQKQYIAHNQPNDINSDKAGRTRPGNLSFTHPNVPAHQLPDVVKGNITDSKNSKAEETLIATAVPLVNKNNGLTKSDSSTKLSAQSVVPAQQSNGIDMVGQTRKAGKTLLAAAPPVNKNSNLAKSDSGTKLSAQSIAPAQQSNGIDMLNQTKKANKTLFANDEVQANKKQGKPEATEKAVRFGVYAATYFNYAKGSNNQMNVGAGVSSDIKLGKNLNLSTGLSVAQNTFGFGDQLPPANGKIAATAAPAASLSYAQTAFSAAYPSLKNYNANLVGLDVPLNLKYEFNPEKNATFISFGVSSGTFINETYTATYNYQTPFASVQSQTTDQSVKQSFNSFYFAKTLNFSFGTGYRIGGNDLIIEPFVKYPLEGLGSQQIKFGSGGLNLKFNFQGRHK